MIIKGIEASRKTRIVFFLKNQRGRFEGSVFVIIAGEIG
jgi:hypothetical protein